jgi:hypothetical protein
MFVLVHWFTIYPVAPAPVLPSANGTTVAPLRYAEISMALTREQADELGSD